MKGDPVCTVAVLLQQFAEVDCTRVNLDHGAVFYIPVIICDPARRRHPVGPVSRSSGEVVGVSVYAPAHPLRYLHVVFLVSVAGPTVPRCGLIVEYLYSLRTLPSR